MQEITQISAIYDLWSKKEIMRRFNTMHSIEMTPSWLFSHAKCKRNFFILIFCIDICSFVNNLLNNVNIFTWSPIKQHMFICQWHVNMLRISLNDFSIFTWSLIRQCSYYVNDMTCWNNFDINEFWPNNSDDMM